MQIGLGQAPKSCAEWSWYPNFHFVKRWNLAHINGASALNIKLFFTEWDESECLGMSPAVETLSSFSFSPQKF